MKKIKEYIGKIPKATIATLISATSVYLYSESYISENTLQFISFILLTLWFWANVISWKIWWIYNNEK